MSQLPSPGSLRDEASSKNIPDSDADAYSTRKLDSAEMFSRRPRNEKKNFDSERIRFNIKTESLKCFRTKLAEVVASWFGCWTQGLRILGLNPFISLLTNIKWQWAILIKNIGRDVLQLLKFVSTEEKKASFGQTKLLLWYFVEKY